MKKSLVLSIIILLSMQSLTVQAQEQEAYARFEVSVSAGYNMPLFYGDMWSYVPDYTKLMYEATFRYFPKSWLSVGLSAGNSHLVYEGKGFSALVTPSVHFHWLRKSRFTAYSGIGYSLPVTAEDWKDPMTRQYWYKGFQYTPIGITFGRSLFGLAELGYGIRYYPVRLGIGYRF